ASPVRAKVFRAVRRETGTVMASSPGVAPVDEAALLRRQRTKQGCFVYGRGGVSLRPVVIGCSDRAVYPEAGAAGRAAPAARRPPGRPRIMRRTSPTGTPCRAVTLPGTDMAAPPAPEPLTVEHAGDFVVVRLP